MPDLTKKKKSTTVLGKTPKKKTTLSKLVNSPSMSPDLSGDRNVSGGELLVEAGLTAIGGKLAAKALSKIGGKSVGKLVTKFANKMFPSSGKNIAKAVKKPEYKSIYKGKTKREGYFQAGMNNNKKKYATDILDVSDKSSDVQRDMAKNLHKYDKSIKPPKK